mmetsp:Transcript_43285/g.94247  ORF Transcript_43285/g.94247 Transcript_43285/m.94247 type:complete len:482 (+) Transcript_43285:83-1528(+)
MRAYALISCVAGLHRETPVSSLVPMAHVARGFCLAQNGTEIAVEKDLGVGKTTLLQNPVVEYVKNRVEQINNNASLKVLPFDGYFSMGCFADSTPAELWVKAPKGGEKVSPRMCFNFCRDKPEARFFGLVEGRVCYCVPYPTLSGGNGGSEQCTAVCEGDSGAMCGGMTKSSIYEMHRCGDVTEGATKDKEAAEELLEEWEFKAGRWQYVVSALTEAGKLINVSDVRQRLFDLASKMEALLKDTNSKIVDLRDKLAPLQAALDNFDATAATAEMMQAVEDAQSELGAFVAALEESAENLKAYWDKHNLDGSMAFRSIDSKALGAADELAKALSTDVNFMPKKVREDVDCDETPSDGCSAFPDQLTYFAVGDHLAALFQVYNQSNPIEGRPTLAGPAEWKKWSVKECHQMCLMTPSCVAGNVIGMVNSSVYASTCNLKSSVTKVELSKGGDALFLMSGFMFSSYFKAHQKEIKFNVANMKIE